MYCRVSAIVQPIDSGSFRIQIMAPDQEEMEREVCLEVVMDSI